VGDLDRALQINQANTPAVGELDRDRLAFLLTDSAIASAAVVDGDLAGFVMVLAPGSSYGSVNYRWFQNHYPTAWYLDRVVIDRAQRRRGIATRLYRCILDDLARRHVSALGLEVNTVPPNPDSMLFHERMGFRTVGTQSTPYGAQVALMLRDVDSNRSGATTLE